MFTTDSQLSLGDSSEGIRYSSQVATPPGDYFMNGDVREYHGDMDRTLPCPKQSGELNVVEAGGIDWKLAKQGQTHDTFCRSSV